MKEVSGIAGGVTAFRQGSQGWYLPGDPDLNEENESWNEGEEEREILGGGNEETNTEVGRVWWCSEMKT